MAAAMWLYPGGTWLDRRVEGHQFFANFFCDLTQPVSLSGVRNGVGAACAQLGMLFFAAALANFFWLLPRHFLPESRLGPWVRWLGQGAVLTFLAVPLTPSERFGRWHAWLSLTAGAVGIVATVFALLALARSHRRARGLAKLGALALFVCGFDAALFVYHLGDMTPPLIVPAAQKVAAILVCVWMIDVAWLARALARGDVSRLP